MYNKYVFIKLSCGVHCIDVKNKIIKDRKWSAFIFGLWIIFYEILFIFYKNISTRNMYLRFKLELEVLKGEYKNGI